MSKSRKKRGNISPNARRAVAQPQASRKPKKPSEIIEFFVGDVAEVNKEIGNLRAFISANRDVVVASPALPSTIKDVFNKLMARIDTAQDLMNSLLRASARIEELDSVSAQMELFIQHQSDFFPIMNIMQEVAAEFKAMNPEVQALLHKAQMEAKNNNAPDAKAMFDPITEINSMDVEDVTPDVVDPVEVALDKLMDDAAAVPAPTGPNSDELVSDVEDVTPTNEADTPLSTDSVDSTPVPATPDTTTTDTAGASASAD